MCNPFDYLTTNPSDLCRMYWQMQQMHVSNPLAFWMIVITIGSFVLGLLGAMANAPKKDWIDNNKRKPGPWEL